MAAFAELTVLVSPSLCGSWQEESWLSWLSERVRGHRGMLLCLLHGSEQRCKCRRQEKRVQKKKTG